MAKDGNNINVRHPLNSLVKGWVEKIRLAKKYKEEMFQRDADVAMKFFTCGKQLNDLLWKDRIRNLSPDEGDEELPAPRFRILVGKVSELVQLFGPSLYHRNPTIIVEPKSLDIPMDLLMSLVPPQVMQQAQMAAQQQGQQFDPASLFPPEPEETQSKLTALLLQYYLDYMQRENDKKTQSRRMIDEALIKGMGCLWTEWYTPYEGGPKLIGSFHDNVDNLLIDPDAECLEDAKWIARRCVKPIWEVADKFEIDEEFLFDKYGTHESWSSQGESIANREATRDRPLGKTNDLMEYWEIWSKMGMGHKLAGMRKIEGLDDMLDSFGENCYIVVAKEVPFPLNLPSKKAKKAMTDDTDEDQETGPRHEAFMRCQWAIPFWADGSWPMTPLAFHEVPGNVWPQSHIKAGLGYLEFMTWCMSFLVNRLRTSCATVVAVAKALDEELKQQLLSGKDFRMLEVSANLAPDGDIKKLVHFFEMPPVQIDTWKILDACSEYFDKATGLSELMYAQQGGMRSAQEASLKQSALQIRPDDMASTVEDVMSLIARKEAMAARWMLDAKSVEAVLGQRGSQLWENYVMTGDINKVAREFHYRVEAGSSRKPNKETRVQQINQALQQWLPVLGAWALQSGNHQIINAFLTDWGQAMDVEVKKYMLPPPPPPPPNPEVQKVQAAIAKGQAELEIKQKEFELKAQEHMAKIEAEKQKLQIQVQGEMAKTQAQVEAQRMKAQADMQKAHMGMQIDREKAANQIQLQHTQMQGEMQQRQQEMHLDAAGRQQEMQMDHAARAHEIQMADQQHKQQMVQSHQEHSVNLQQAKTAGKQKLQQSKAESTHKMQVQKQQMKMKAQAQKQKPKAKPKPKGKKK